MTKTVKQIPYFYDDLRPEGAIGNQSFIHLSAKRYSLSYLFAGNILLAEKVGSQIQKIYINDGQGINWNGSSHL
jgi:hypothetical protein